MNLEEAIEEIKKMFWGVLKGEYNPDEEENVKAHLITNLATLTSFAKSFLPLEQQEEYEKHFQKAKDVLLKFDSAGPWFRELPEMTDTVYNVITHANMLQIEYQRSVAVDNDALQYLNAKLESLELSLHSLNEEIKKIKAKTSKSPKGEIIEKETVSEKKVEVIHEIDTKEKEEVIKDTLSEKEAFDEETKGEGADEEIDTTKTETASEMKDEIVIKEKEDISSDAKDLIEGIELASQYEFEQEPFMQTMESEQESLRKLASLLTALDPGDDSVISPLTEKLLTLGDDISSIPEQELIIDEGLTDEELEEVHAFRTSVSRLGSVLSAPEGEEDAAEFVSSIKKTIAHVSEEKDIEPEEKSPLTKMIEAESGETEKPPVQSEDIQNIITHLESKRQKALERIQQLEQALNSEKIDEEEWQELRIKAEKHVLRIEDTLDGYRRYIKKI
ncbi:MAG: hypothetical protein H7647_01995 [Candidatus Heimdallarchaeota archaeon]|nr:hypothetical protein [Candidatus Heimdallarchaeota archaeon]MCK4253200.1 hypothetical protein [Candidatus Heimdallarchaeota archaeon]